MAKMKSLHHQAYNQDHYFGLTLGRAKKIMARHGADSVVRGIGRISFYNQERREFIGDFWHAGRKTCEDSKSFLIVCCK